MLQEYKRRRDFNLTPEPSGKLKPSSKKRKGSLTFVIQKHAASRLHYDFRLEVDGVMVSWAVPKGPSLNPADKRLAVMTEDHPMEYSDFEGIIPEKQYGAGEVIIWDQGIYSPDRDEKFSWNSKDEANSRMRDGLRKGRISFYLKGTKLEGSWALVKLSGKEKDWLLIKHRDNFVDTERDVTLEDESIVSGQTIEDLQANGATRIWTRQGAQAADPSTTGKSWKTPKSAKPAKAPARTRKQPVDLDKLTSQVKKARFPHNLSPMLATLADEPFTRDGWFFEPKLDGIRALAYVKDGKVQISSRRGIDYTAKYPEIVKDLSKYNHDFIFDGEIVALDELGKPSFQHLKSARLHAPERRHCTERRESTASRPHPKL